MIYFKILLLNIANMQTKSQQKFTFRDFFLRICIFCCTFVCHFGRLHTIKRSNLDTLKHLIQYGTKRPTANKTAI